MTRNKLGERVRKFREKHDMTRDELASRAGLDVSFLENVEERDLYPSLGPLVKISRALGVRLGAFLDDEISIDPLIVRLQDREESLSMHVDGDHPASLTYHSLGRGKTDRHMEPFHIELAPADGDKTLSSHEGEEFIFVLSGQVELLHGLNRHVLGPGDSLFFNSITPHHVGPAGAEPAQIVAVLYFPEA